MTLTPQELAQRLIEERRITPNTRTDAKGSKALLSRSKLDSAAITRKALQSSEPIWLDYDYARCIGESLSGLECAKRDNCKRYLLRSDKGARVFIAAPEQAVECESFLDAGRASHA